MSPLEKYQQDLTRSDFIADQGQYQVVLKLEALFKSVIRLNRKKKSSLIRKIKPSNVRARRRHRSKLKGLYLYGGVGRGKTYLMDTFFSTLPPARKTRLHYHRFMQAVHDKLGKYQGRKNPLKSVAEDFVKKADVLCLDEFFVKDITDAMLLANLFEAMLERSLIIVMTSNIPPEDLYKDGLQRARFLPAIALIEKHLDVVHIENGDDFRLRTLVKECLYHSPLNEEADKKLKESFDHLVFANVKSSYPIEVLGRDITSRYVAEDVVWFSFDELCVGPRSQNDYIELAKQFHTVIISGITVLDASCDDVARRFINCIDEFYDRRVKLIISAEQEIDELYRSGGTLQFEFERTRSRLHEMQSREYLSEEHLG